MTVPFIRKSTQRNSSWPGDLNLQQQAEYICADLSFDPSLFPLQSGGGPYIFESFAPDRDVERKLLGNVERKLLGNVERKLLGNFELVRRKKIEQ
jgi:hypothetical protein